MPYFCSVEYQCLCNVLHEQGIHENDCVFVEIGHDGFLPYQTAAHRSTWGVWMRVKNIDPAILFRYMNVRELALWPQPKCAR